MFKKGHKHSEETKKKIGLIHKGRKLSVEHRLKLSIAHKGQIPWQTGTKGLVKAESY